MKVKIFVALFLLLGTLFTGCQMFQKGTDDKASQQTAYEKIQNALISLETYQSQATVEYISNKGKNAYQTTQQCKSTGEYRVEVTAPETVAGSITTFDGKTISQHNPRLSMRVATNLKENQERSEIFVTSFVKNYLKSQEVSISVGNFGDGKCAVLEAVIPGKHPYLSTEKLWVDNKTLKPVKLEVYDPDGVARIIVTYNTFEYNGKLDDAIFRVN